MGYCIVAGGILKCAQSYSQTPASLDFLGSNEKLKQREHSEFRQVWGGRLSFICRVKIGNMNFYIGQRAMRHYFQVKLEMN